MTCVCTCSITEQSAWWRALPCLACVDALCRASARVCITALILVAHKRSVLPGLQPHHCCARKLLRCFPAPAVVASSTTCIIHSAAA